jgi:hypothetical protein
MIARNQPACGPTLGLSPVQLTRVSVSATLKPQSGPGRKRRELTRRATPVPKVIGARGVPNLTTPYKGTPHGEGVRGTVVVPVVQPLP